MTRHPFPIPPLDRLSIETARVSLVVWPQEPLRDATFRGKLEVRLADESRAAIINPSGMHCFQDLAPGQRVLSVRPRHDTGLVPFDESIVVPAPNLGPAVLELVLGTAPHYRFPTGATLIRSRVLDSTGEPRANARVVVLGVPRAATWSDAEGYFAVALPGFAGQANVTVEVSLDGDTVQRPVVVDEGESHVLNPFQMP